VRRNMKIAFPNIFTSFGFVAVQLSGGMLAYISIDRNLFLGDLIFIGKFFIGLVILFATVIAIKFLVHFRILFIRDHTLFSVKPFIFKLKKIDLTQKLKIKWSIWDVTNKISCRKIRIVERAKHVIEFSDFEFENFDAIVSQIDKTGYNAERAKVDLYQAKEDVLLHTFTLFILAFIFVIIVCINLIHIFHWIHVVFYLCIMLLSYSAITKRKRCRKIMKQQMCLNT